jgi:GxxExxY protein
MLHKDLSEKIIGCAIEVHKNLGPGLLESAYEECLCYEFTREGLIFERQKSISIAYKEITICNAYRIDLLVENSIIIEIKSVEAILPVHEAQLLTYLTLSGKKVGLLINFNEKILKNGLKRIVN